MIAPMMTAKIKIVNTLAPNGKSKKWVSHRAIWEKRYQVQGPSAERDEAHNPEA